MSDLLLGYASLAQPAFRLRCECRSWQFISPVETHGVRLCGVRLCGVRLCGVRLCGVRLSAVYFHVSL
ncbi:MAG: hypothetical protein V2I97_23755 [Desulfococcaceae bacterium]|nr:hypothetical protein [Desulfococcaceae bacterium]